VLQGVQNDEFTFYLLGFVPARLPWPHSLWCVRVWSAVLWLQSVRILKNYISQGNVATRLRRGGIFNGSFVANFLQIVGLPVTDFLNGEYLVQSPGPAAVAFCCIVCSQNTSGCRISGSLVNIAKWKPISRVQNGAPLLKSAALSGRTPRTCLRPDLQQTWHHNAGDGETPVGCAWNASAMCVPVLSLGGILWPFVLWLFVRRPFVRVAFCLRVAFLWPFVRCRPLSRIFWKIRLAEQKFRLISGLAEFLRKL